jgi:hypothetical protein
LVILQQKSVRANLTPAKQPNQMVDQSACQAQPPQEKVSKNQK